MKRAQMLSDKRNILAVVTRTFGSMYSYTIYYVNGKKRTYNSPSVAVRSRFDWWYRRLDTADYPFASAERICVLMPSYSSDIPDRVRFDVPAIDTLESEGFIL